MSLRCEIEKHGISFLNDDVVLSKIVAQSTGEIRVQTDSNAAARIVNLATPIDNTDAATKQYVDQRSAGVSGGQVSENDLILSRFDQPDLKISLATVQEHSIGRLSDVNLSQTPTFGSLLQFDGIHFKTSNLISIPMRTSTEISQLTGITQGTLVYASDNQKMLFKNTNDWSSLVSLPASLSPTENGQPIVFSTSQSGWTPAQPGSPLALMGNLQPNEDETLDVGTPATKLRNVFVGNSGIFIGNFAKLEFANGSLQTKTRDPDALPIMIEEKGGTESGALSNSGKSTLTEITIEEWITYARTLPNLENATAGDVFDSTFATITENSNNYFTMNNDVLKFDGNLEIDDPVSSAHASTKNYVDQKVVASGSIVSSNLVLSKGDASTIQVDVSSLSRPNLNSASYDSSSTSLSLQMSDSTTHVVNLSDLQVGEHKIQAGDNGLLIENGSFDGNPVTTTISLPQDLRKTAIVEFKEVLTSSDRNLKKDIRGIGGVLHKMNNIKAKSFLWKSDSNAPRRIGLIAQDVEENFPEAIMENSGGKKINQASLISILFSAVNELRVEIEKLRKK